MEADSDGASDAVRRPAPPTLSDDELAELTSLTMWRKPVQALSIEFRGARRGRREYQADFERCVEPIDDIPVFEE